MRNSSRPAAPTPGEPIAQAKSRRRQYFRARRRSRTATEIADAGRLIAAHLGPLIDGARIVAAFAATPLEPATGPMLELLAHRGCEIRLPLIDGAPSSSGDLTIAWARHTPGAFLTPASAGRPPMPTGPALPPESIAEAELILVPALAVDTRGTRLGQGGGWYDRALLPRRPEVAIYGVVFSEEFTAIQLPASAHDVPLTGIITPDGFTELPANLED